MSVTVDVHNHFYPDRFPDFPAHYEGNWPGFRRSGPGSGMITLGGRDYRPVSEACWNPVVRIEEMDRDDVDVQIMSATPLLFMYDKPAGQASEFAKYMNDQALELCSHDPSRLKSLCQVPLQDIDASCTELSRAMRSGHVGVQIGNHVELRNLDDEGLLTFLRHCASEDAAVLVHPWDMMASERMPRYMLRWLVGMPAETQLSILSLILSGAFERLPSELRLYFAHGGGSFSFLLGRVENAWEHRDIVREDCPRRPSEYLSRFYVDSAVFDESALALLVDIMGQDRVMLGSDYPFPLGEQVVGKLVRNTDSLSEIGKKKILGGNAAEFFRLG